MSSEIAEKDDPRISYRQRDRQFPELAQARGHHKRIRDLYPQIWEKSTITNMELATWIRDNKGKPCAYCGKPSREIDHKTPLIKGGMHEWDNLQLICGFCNKSKHDMTAEEFKAKLPELQAEQQREDRKYGLTLADYGMDVKILMDKGIRYRTRSLFKETWDRQRSGNEPPIFTLTKEEDTEDGLISIKRIYLAYEDPTEYTIARKLFNSVYHWRKLCNNAWFLKYLKQWRAELRSKIKSFATLKLIEQAKTSGPTQVQSLKSLIQDNFIYTSFLEETEPLPKKKVGRPEKVIPEESIDQQTLEQDLARIQAAK